MGSPSFSVGLLLPHSFDGSRGVYCIFFVSGGTGHKEVPSCSDTGAQNQREGSCFGRST